MAWQQAAAQISCRLLRRTDNIPLNLARAVLRSSGEVSDLHIPNTSGQSFVGKCSTTSLRGQLNRGSEASGLSEYSDTPPHTFQAHSAAVPIPVNQDFLPLAVSAAGRETVAEGAAGEAGFLGVFSEGYECGRGDKRTKKGKVFKGSHGNSRPSRGRQQRRLREKWELPPQTPLSEIQP